MKVRIGQQIMADVYGSLVLGEVIGFGVEKGRQVADLDNGRWVYISQIIG
jgi:hypothetical protein